METTVTLHPTKQRGIDISERSLKSQIYNKDSVAIMPKLTVKKIMQTLLVT